MSQPFEDWRLSSHIGLIFRLYEQKPILILPLQLSAFRFFRVYSRQKIEMFKQICNQGNQPLFPYQPGSPGLLSHIITPTVCPLNILGFLYFQGWAQTAYLAHWLIIECWRRGGARFQILQIKSKMSCSNFPSLACRF